MCKYLTILSMLLLLIQSSVAQQAAIKGRILDKMSNRPVPYATIVVWQSSTGTVSDDEGNYQLEVESNVVRLEVACLGYETYLTEELNLTRGTSTRDIYLEELILELSEVTIQTNPFRKNEESPVALQRIGISEIEKNPGANRDISKVIQSFPGVASTVAYRNDLIVRGGGPSENGFYLDGMKIPNLNHFATQGASGGPVGIINADLIQQVDFYSGAFPAAKGDVLSSVLDMRMIDGNSDEFKWKGTLGASEVALSVDGPLSEKTTMLLSVRRSYLQFLFDVLGLPFLPTYNDFTLKTKTKIDDRNELTIIGIGAYDYSRLNLSVDDTEEGRYILGYLPENDQWNYAVGAVYKHYGDNSYRTIAFSRNHLYNGAYKFRNNDDSSDDNKILDYNSDEIENHLRFENNSRIGNYKLISGIELLHATYKNNTFRRFYQNDVSAELNYNTDMSLFGYGIYFQGARKSDNQRLTLSAGLRLDANDYSTEMNVPIEQISPRFSISYQLFDKWYLNGNVGRYYKLPAYTMLGFRNSQGSLINRANNIKYIRSDQVAVGVEYRVRNNAIITLESFYKLYRNYPFSVEDSVSMATKGAGYGVFGDEEVTPNSEGRAYGVELMSRWSGTGGLTFVAAYTLVRSEFKEKGGDYISSSWDNKHVFTITGSQRLANNWSVGLKWRYLGGVPYTPYDTNKSSLVQAWDVQNQGYLDYAAFNTKRLSAFHQLDIRIDKTYYFKNWMLGFYLDLQNVYNSQYQGQDDLILDDSSGEPVIVNPEAPIAEQRYKLKRIENESGTIVPTIGIMVEF